MRRECPECGHGRTLTAQDLVLTAQLIRRFGERDGLHPEFLRRLDHALAAVDGAHEQTSMEAA